MVVNPAPTQMHLCPGGCGGWIGPTVIASIDCWKRVPLDLRKALWTARKWGGLPARLAAAWDVIEWLKSNPER